MAPKPPRNTDDQLVMPWNKIVTPAPSRKESPQGNWSLSRTRRYIRERIPEGINCPACRQHAKVYRRPIRTGWTYALALIATAPIEIMDSLGFIHATSHINAMGKGTEAASGVAIAGDWQLMRHWRLIKPGEGRGMWRVTEMGMSFLSKKLSIPVACLLYNNALVGFDPKLIRVDEADGAEFDLDAIMEPARLDPI